MARAYLSIGANLGDRRRICLQALDLLDRIEKTSLVARSGLYETEPQGFVDQPVFINLAVELQTGLSVKVPVFVKEGDKVKVDTRTGEYIERAN